MSTHEDETLSACPPTPDPSVVHSLDTLLIIHEDWPFETTDAEVGLD